MTINDSNSCADKVNEKHLEFIQSVITRHNSNSFTIKGWIITIVASILAFAGALKESYLVFIAIGPVLIFWWLDAFYLANERSFISLYSSVSKGGKLKVMKKKLIKKEQKNIGGDDIELSVPNFSMNFNQFKIIKRNTICSTFFSRTIIGFYSSLIALVVLGFFGMWYVNSTKSSDDKNKNVNTCIHHMENTNQVEVPAIQLFLN